MTTIKHLATEVVTILQENGFTAYFAGGFVRDLLLGIASHDIDIATDAHPEQIAKLFPEHILVGAQFGVCIVRHKQHQFEIATFRQDLEYTDGRRPNGVNLQVTAVDDAKRRDFTINGLFFDPHTNEILDFVNGKHDLDKKIIRTIGNPITRFEEDRLRMIRAVRFAKRFDFIIEEKTKEAICTLAHTLLPSVSMERIWQEFVKMKKTARFCDALIEMAEVGLLQTIFEPLKGINSEIVRERLSGLHDVAENVPPILILSALFTETELSYVLGLGIYLRASNEETKLIEHFLEFRTLFKTDPTFSNRFEWAILLANPRAHHSITALLASFDKKAQEKSKAALHRLQEELEFHIECIRKRKPLCTAKDLENAFGMRPGKQMGQLLKLAQHIAITENIQDIKTLLQKLQSDPNLITLI